MVLFLPFIFFFFSSRVSYLPIMLLWACVWLLCAAREQGWGDGAIAWTSLRPSKKGAQTTLLAFALMLRKAQRGTGVC